MFMTYNSGPMWLLAAVLAYRLFYWFMGVFCGWTEEEEEDDGLVEGLSDYYDALKIPDQAAYIGSQEYFAKYYCKTMSDE